MAILFFEAYLKLSMGEERILTSALLHIEGRVMQKMEFDDLIDDFASHKARRKAISY